MNRGHKGAHTDLTAEYVRSILHYDPETGLFHWKVMLSKRRVSGRHAGFAQAGGRIKIGINGREYMAHRLAWLYVTGSWPEYEVDHVNEDASDNRWSNLRHATPSQNLQNRGVPKNNTSGYKGVCEFKPGRFVAYIKVNKKRHHIGLFNSAEEAYAARCEVAKKMLGEWAWV